MIWQKSLVTAIATTGTAISLVAGSGLSANAAGLNFSKLYAFGDSLSDTGNLYTLTGGQPPLPFYGTPTAPGRFSNGFNWIDYLSQDLKLTVTPFAQISPQFLPDPAVTTQSINFALGGSTTGLDNTLSPFLPGLKQQIQAYAGSLLTAQKKADPKALYILWAGANDYLPTNSLTFTPYQNPTTTLSNLDFALKTLIQFGAKTIAVANLPDLGKLPKTLGTSDENRLNQLAQEHNVGLSQEVKTLKKVSGANVFSLDFASLFSKNTNPATSAFKDLDIGYLQLAQACSQVPTPRCFDLQNPDQFLFWDEQHPTTAAHKLLAENAYATIDKAVPEPAATAGLLAIGALGALSAIQRKRAVKRDLVVVRSPR